MKIDSSGGMNNSTRIWGSRRVLKVYPVGVVGAAILGGDLRVTDGKMGSGRSTSR